MRVKICGITRYEDAILSSDLGADAVGFVFYKESKRFIETNTAAQIIKELPFFIQKIGVFVDETAEKINEIAFRTGLTGIQLHGNETPEYIKEIKLPVIKAFRVSLFFNYDILYQYKKTPLLLDGYDPALYGGTGTTFDWSLIPEKIKSQITLAGGIKCSNLEQIKQKINPAAIDVSSSVEDSPGIKSKIKLEKLFNKINQLR